MGILDRLLSFKRGDSAATSSDHTAAAQELLDKHKLHSDVLNGEPSPNSFGSHIARGHLDKLNDQLTSLTELTSDRDVLNMIANSQSSASFRANEKLDEMNPYLSKGGANGSKRPFANLFKKPSGSVDAPPSSGDDSMSVGDKSDGDANMPSGDADDRGTSQRRKNMKSQKKPTEKVETQDDLDAEQRQNAYNIRKQNMFSNIVRNR